mmetsp:Transcript_17825/g.39080  ORF Transcript_17825/g.39080 Transcript_17825/m.39080 type:complete len:598 (-) Transcript_17825:78-1871(-)
MLASEEALAENAPAEDARAEDARGTSRGGSQGDSRGDSRSARAEDPPGRADVVPAEQATPAEETRPADEEKQEEKLETEEKEEELQYEGQEDDFEEDETANLMSPTLTDRRRSSGSLARADRADLADRADRTDLSPPPLLELSGGLGSPQSGRTAPDWHQPLKPESHEMWHQKTLAGLNHAKALTRHALRNVMDNESLAPVKTLKAKGTEKEKVHNMIRKKIGVTEDIVRSLEDRMESVEDTIRQIGECLFSLQRAHRSKWAPLNVCERRLELRESRPLQELVRDHCQEALEHERQCLIEARQEIADQMENCKTMLVNLDSMRDQLVDDLQHKRHALRIDRSCLGPLKVVHVRAQDRLVLPQLQDVANYGAPPSPQGAEVGTGGEHEDSRQADSNQLIANAMRLEEDAIRLCNESDAIMLHTKRETQRACMEAQKAVTRRADETNALRRKLEAQMMETDQMVSHTEMSLAKMKKKLDAHDAPLRVLDKQFAMRGKRTTREGIRDPVHEEMETHLHSLKKSVTLISGKCRNTGDVLDQLKASKQQLQEDYRAKLAAQRIEEQVVKMTPRKAIELDRMDPRSGRCSLVRKRLDEVQMQS